MMGTVFTRKDIDKISKILGVEFKTLKNNYRAVIDNPDKGHHLSLELYPDIPIGEQNGNLVSVYTNNSHLQLHFCTGYVISEFLGEVTFISECEGRVSGLIIEKEGGCSLYANVGGQLLSGDFTRLGPEVMLSGIALSIAEDILPNKKNK
jgi:hypothetical protein